MVLWYGVEFPTPYWSESSYIKKRAVQFLAGLKRAAQKDHTILTLNGWRQLVPCWITSQLAASTLLNRHHYVHEWWVGTDYIGTSTFR